jgi:hypothetical protein
MWVGRGKGLKLLNNRILGFFLPRRVKEMLEQRKGWGIKDSREP